MKKIIILGSVSFLLDKARVGINYIAEYLAENGYKVYYLSSSSSSFDLLSKPRRARFYKAWIGSGEYQVKPNLIEVIPRTPWLLNRTRHHFLINWTFFLNRHILKQQYDVLISTIGALSIFSTKIDSPAKILRLQDLAHDFGMSKFLVRQIEINIVNNVYKQIWSVSYGLFNYAKELGQIKNNYYLPNGVSLKQFLAKFSNKDNKKCIYVGAFDDWVDINLIKETAKLLKDWQFDLYGHKFNATDLPDNVTYHGLVEHKNLPQILSACSVGLIPFANTPVTSVIERPLKFSEYLAVGLGIASTKLTSLKDGMENWATYGNTPKEFATAILDANLASKQRTKQAVIDYLKEYEWTFLLDQMHELLKKC